MPITAEAPSGGIVEQMGGESRPLILRNGEIERFEKQHSPIGIFEVLDQLIRSGNPQSRHCRDLVALGLVGGGMSDKDADRLVDDMPPHQNVRIRAIAQDLVFAAFVDPEDLKKNIEEPVGSLETPSPKATKRKPKSKAP